MAVALVASPLAVAGAGSPASVVSSGEPAGYSATVASWPAFSDPKWYPLRDPAQVDCSYRNCKSGSYHPYWAIDLAGEQGDRIYPSGAGTVHIGDRDSTCRPRGSVVDSAWVFVDHGGGVFTKYKHFGDVFVQDGQRVTPATALGTLGHSGIEPCQARYVHFEVRVNGILGDTHVNPGQLRRCLNGALGLLPRDAGPGYSSWSAMPTTPGNREIVSSEGVGCVPPPSAVPAQPSVSSISHGASSITLRWRQAPPPVDRVAVSISIFNKSTGNFRPPDYRRLGDNVTATTFSGLRSGRPYRFRLAFHNSTGWSPWSPTREYMYPRQ